VRSFLLLLLCTLLPLAVPLSAGAEQPTNTAAEPEPPKHLTVAVLGDSLADGVWGALYRKHVREKRLTIYRGAKNSIGFGGGDLMDMIDAAFSAGPVDAVVMMIGANDRRGVYATDGSLAAPYKSPKWPAAYGARVEGFMDAIAARKVPLIWILLPVMREDDASLDAKRINMLVEGAAEIRPGVTLVKTWPMTIDGEGAYSAYLKDAKGQAHLVRAPDGVHFTDLGYDMIGAVAFTKLLEVSPPFQRMLQPKQ